MLESYSMGNNENKQPAEQVRINRIKPKKIKKMYSYLICVTVYHKYIIYLK